jgi:alkyl sulfatase BDS1-like metallo-beta-lactamase superfamily hydrolase
MLLGLVPVQRALLPSPLEYDLTIRGSGTYAVSIGSESASARTIGEPRPRDQAAFHLSADIVTLTELLAGVEKRMGRWLGSVKVRGRRQGAEALRDALAGADLDLAAAARAGAELEPDLVFRAFAYAIHPAWTKGHTFTVAQEILDPRPLRWHVAVRDGAPVAVDRRPSSEPPDAVVAMTRTAFSHLLRGEPVPSGERPAIRGDRAAVATLKAWTDRAQRGPA